MTSKTTRIGSSVFNTSDVPAYEALVAEYEALRVAARIEATPANRRAVVEASAVLSSWMQQHEVRHLAGAPASRAGKRQNGERRAMEQARQAAARRRSY